MFQVQKPTGEESIEGTGSMTTPSSLARSLSPRGRGRGRGAPPRRSRSPGPKPRSAERDGGPGNQLQGKGFQSYFLISILFQPNVVDNYIFQTINSVRSDILNLKYQRFTPSGCTDRGLSKFEFVAKTQFLSDLYCSKKV